MVKKLRIIHVVALIGMYLSLLLVSTSGYAQNGVVTGTVTDAANGQPLPGVTVKVRGTSLATTTNVNGGYSIKVNPNSKLIFSFIGYTDQEVEVGAGNVYNIKLAASSSNLNEVVVIGYGTAKRKDLCLLLH
jgi:TonB-dependent starch-binding outer membrane protein SusC